MVKNTKGPLVDTLAVEKYITTTLLTYIITYLLTYFTYIHAYSLTN